MLIVCGEKVLPTIFTTWLELNVYVVPFHVILSQAVNVSIGAA